MLPVCVGAAARLFDYIIDKQKTYVATLKLGQETDTQDATGQVVRERPVSVTEEDVRRVLRELTGVIRQVPPMYSAIKRMESACINWPERENPWRFPPGNAGGTGCS